MKLVLRDSLMFVPATLSYRGVMLQIDDILVDTGSTTTLHGVHVGGLTEWAGDVHCIETVRKKNL